MPEDRKPTKAEDEAVKAASEAEDKVVSDAEKVARSAESTGEAARQQVPLADMPPSSAKSKWFHDASHSADAERLAAQRARDEFEFGIQAPGEDNSEVDTQPPEKAK